MRSRGWINGDFCTGVSVLGIAAVGWYRIRTIPFQSLEAGLGPAFFPVLVLSIVTVLAATLTIKGAFSALRSGSGATPVSIGPLPLKMSGMFVAYAFAFHWIGLLPAGALLLFFSQILLGVKFRLAFVVSAAATIGFYLVFGILFRIRLF